MFSRLSGYINEGYTNSLTPTGQAGQDDIQRMYALNQPIYTTDTTPAGLAGSLDKMTTTLNQQQTSSTPVLRSNQTRSIRPSDLLVQQQAACLGSSSDQFSNLSALASSYDPKSQVRCGWIYNNANPAQGRGSIGVSQGPHVPADGTATQGTWMWDLNAAKQKYHTWLCKQVTSCGQLLNAPYNGRCGWCATSGTAVPITSVGAVAYPADPTTACSSSSLITDIRTCPAPSQSAISAQGWNYLPNGNLPRAALIQLAEQAGCSDQATLIQALHSGSETNYLSALAQQLAYTTYQQRAIPNINESQLKKGNVAIGQALAEFQQVNSQATSTVNDPGLRAAAKDLCITAGAMETYDFCAELLDSTRGPYTLDCLQKQFMRAGGQRAGTMYPSAANLGTWNSYPTWLKVNTTIQEMLTETQSTDRTTQSRAIAQFYGIPIVTSTPMGSVPGVEIFWFTNIYQDVASPNTVFLGRRIRPTIPFINQTNDLQGASNRDNVSMVFFTNISYPNYNGPADFRVTADDGFGIAFKTSLGQGYRNGLRITDANSLVALDYFPPMTFTTLSWSPWMLTAQGPNKLSGLWFQGWGGLYFRFEVRDGPWMEVPAANLNLTQEAYAPMMSFQVYRSPQNFGADFNFADTRMGALKMKWAAQSGTPAWYYSTDGPLSLPYVNYKPASSMNMLGSFKIYSFMTMTVLITFNALPANAVTMQEYISMPGALGKIAIQAVGNGTYGQGQLNLYTNTGGRGPTTASAGLVKQGVPYLLSLTVNRATQSDIYSANGVSLGIQELAVLKSDPTRLQYTASVTFPNPSSFSNPNSTESRTMVVGNGDINVTWIRLYDYYLDSNAIAREVSNNWKYL